LKRVDEASDTSPWSPAGRRSRHVDEVDRAAASDGRSSAVWTANSRWPTGSVGVSQSRAGAASGSP
jgi:hypothetical protein